MVLTIEARRPSSCRWLRSRGGAVGGCDEGSGLGGDETQPEASVACGEPIDAGAAECTAIDAVADVMLAAEPAPETTSVVSGELGSAKCVVVPAGCTALDAVADEALAPGAQACIGPTLSVMSDPTEVMSVAGARRCCGDAETTGQAMLAVERSRCWPCVVDGLIGVSRLSEGLELLAVDSVLFMLSSMVEVMLTPPDTTCKGAAECE